MFVMRFRQWRSSARLRFDPSLSLILLLSLFVAGCGGRQGHAPTADARVAAPPQSHFQAALVERPIELEADGLPVQRAPLMRRTRMPDDPSEPFSPNYGNPPVPTDQGRTAAADLRTHADVKSVSTANGPKPEHAIVRVSINDLPEDLPPDFRERLIVSNALR